jgi:hypothetical protein
VLDRAPELPIVDSVFLVSLPAGLVFAADFVVLALIPAGSHSPLEAFSCAGSRTRFVERATDFPFGLRAKDSAIGRDP